MSDSTFSYAAAIAQARHARQRDKGAPPVTCHDQRAAFLDGMAGDVCSQTGEDGLIAALFAAIGVRNRWAFEVGAGDGIFLSNTWALRQDGWDAVLIEADPDLYAACRRDYGHQSHVCRARVGPYGTLDTILSGVGAPRDLDLGVIDVDGEDAEVWRGLTLYTPRVMLVEFNPTGDGILGGRTEWQAGLETLTLLGRAKGYALLATTPHNALFVLEATLEEVAL